MRPLAQFLRIRGRLLPVWALLLLVQAACGRGHFYGGTNLSPPTAVVPEYTNQPQLNLTGARSSNTEVWITYLTPVAKPATLLAAAAVLETYAGVGALVEGANSFTLQARRGSSAGPQSAVYTVILKTTAPSAPVITSPDGYFLNGAAQVTGVLAGSCDANSNVHITGPGIDQIVPASAAGTSWSVNVGLVYGPNAFSVQATDLAGNASPVVSVIIRGTRVATPTIDPASYRSPTNQATYSLRGSKPTGAALFWGFDGAAPVGIGTAGSTSWTGPSFSMTAQRAYVAAVYAVDSTNERSATARAVLVYDTVPPAPPRDLIPNLSGLGPTGRDHLTLTATLPADGFLCVSSSAGAQCDLCPLGDPALYPGDTGCLLCSSAAANASCSPYNAGSARVYAGTRTVKVPLHNGADPGYADGFNPLYVTSEDAAGNSSAATTGTIYRIAPPSVSVSGPVNGAVVSGTSLPISFTAQGLSVDDNQTNSIAAGAQLAAIDICLDGANCQSLSPNGSGNVNYSNMVDISQLLSGTSHVLTVSVTDAIGATTTVSLDFAYQGNDPLYVSNTGARQNSQQVASTFDAAGNLHLVWSDSCAQDGNAICKVSVGAATTPPDIFYARRSPAGQWSPIQDVSSKNTDDGHSTAPVLAVDAADRVHVAWVDDGALVGLPGNQPKPNGNALVHRMLYAGGGAVDPNLYIVGAPSAGVADVNPSLAADPQDANGLHLAFTRQLSGIRYNVLYSHFNGTSWTTPLQISTDPNTGLAERPSVTGLANGHAWVAWQECGLAADGNNYCVGNANRGINRDVRLRELASPSSFAVGGIRTVSDKLKDSGSDGDSLRPSIVADPNTLWIFWDDAPNAQPRRGIWLRQLTLASGALSPYQQVSDNTARTDAASASAALVYNRSSQAGTLGVAWSQNLVAGAEAGVAAPPNGQGAAILVRARDLCDGCPDAFDSDANRSAYSRAVQASAPSLALDARANLNLSWQDLGTQGALNPSDRANTTGPLQRIFYKFLPRSP